MTIFHYALPSPMTEAFARLTGGRVLQYHNVTPARVLRALRSGALPPGVAGAAGAGDAGRAASTWRSASREYNRQELEALGFAPTGVLPLAVDLTRITQAAARPALDKMLDDEFVNFLFVGRIAPNKKIEDHIRLAEHYKRYVDAFYRFIFVGRYDAVPRYYATIRALMSEYRLLNERFVFTGPVPDEELAVYYRHAAVYISLSEHEGFCAPLLEAMAADVPILAYCGGGRAGNARRRRRPVRPEGPRARRRARWARWPSTTTCARGVIAGQRRRLADFGDDRIMSDLAALSPIAAATSPHGPGRPATRSGRPA